MDADSWSARVSSLSKRYQPALQSRSDLFLGFEEFDGDDDIKEVYPCPYCSEYFDIVGLCCHIDDEHPLEAKNGVCPVCANKVGIDMKELREGNFQSLFGGSSYIASSNSAAPDPLSSFILPMCDELVKSECSSSADTIFPNIGKEENSVERNVHSPPLSIKDQKERAKRSGFVHELLLSTIFDNKS
ncbi:hypothetical protein V2J09_023600 [Rumex salicifolius]